MQRKETRTNIKLILLVCAAITPIALSGDVQMPPKVRQDPFNNAYEAPNLQHLNGWQYYTIRATDGSNRFWTSVAAYERSGYTGGVEITEF